MFAVQRCHGGGADVAERFMVRDAVGSCRPIFVPALNVYMLRARRALVCGCQRFESFVGGHKVDIEKLT